MFFIFCIIPSGLSGSSNSNIILDGNFHNYLFIFQESAMNQRKIVITF